MDDELAQALDKLQTTIASLHEELSGIGDGLGRIHAEMTAGCDRLDSQLTRLREEMAAGFAAARHAVTAADRTREEVGPSPPMTAEKARDLARTYKAATGNLIAVKVLDLRARTEAVRPAAAAE